jgi:hypothetical protein
MHSVREKGLASNYGEVFFKITNKQYLSKTIQDFFNEGSSYKVRCLSVVIKMKRGHVDCDFDVVPKTEVSCKLSSNQIKQCIKKPNEQCLLRHTQYEKGDEESVRQTVCPQCVDEIAGEAFLNEFEPVLMKACTPELASVFGAPIRLLTPNWKRLKFYLSYGLSAPYPSSRESKTNGYLCINSNDTSIFKKSSNTMFSSLQKIFRLFSSTVPSNFHP